MKRFNYENVDDDEILQPSTYATSGQHILIFNRMHSTTEESIIHFNFDSTLPHYLQMTPL